MPKKITREEFIKRSIEVHGNKYDYSKVEYVNSTTKVCIVCPIHGEFWQRPYSHLTGYGCDKCAIEYRSSLKTKTTEQFITDARKVHGDKYDYSKVEYTGKNDKVCIICPEHGEFWQIPNNHLHGAGCPECKKEHISTLYKDNTTSFIEKAHKIHGDKYDYSKVTYVDSYTPVCIICPKHGEFWQRPNNHIHGWGCSKCSCSGKKTTEEFIKQSKNVHGDKYDYSITNYVNNKTKVEIICKEHGTFTTYPLSHINLGVGCPMCAVYKMEKQIMDMLDDINVTYIWQYRPLWLKRKSIDFYLPDHNIAIECQGEQHYRPVKFYGGEIKYKQQVNSGKVKYAKCLENHIDLIYYTTLKDIEKNENTFESVLDIKDYILNKQINATYLTDPLN